MDRHDTFNSTFIIINNGCRLGDEDHRPGRQESQDMSDMVRVSHPALLAQSPLQTRWRAEEGQYTPVPATATPTPTCGGRGPPVWLCSTRRLDQARDGSPDEPGQLARATNLLLFDFHYVLRVSCAPVTQTVTFSL